MLSATAVPVLDASDSQGHLIGRHGAGWDGPVVVCFGGLHGNEPMGVVALGRVLRRLSLTQPAFRGELLAVKGNLRALSQGSRYLQADLNRIWTVERVRRIRSRDGFVPAASEDQEQKEILEIVDEVFARSKGPIYFIDLHTTSASSGPFSVFGDTLRNRRFALRFPVPIILGLEEQIDGALLEYVNSLGAVTYGFEAGQHDSPASADRHEALVWLALQAAGCLPDASVPFLEDCRRLLAEASRDEPQVVEVRHREAVTPADDFRMLPGFANFQPIRKGQLLAHNRRGEVRAKENGLILMPLYQRLGSDGFFIAREVKPFWLDVSRRLRRLRLDALLPWLPGVRKDPETANALRVNPRVARFFPVEIFHLLGYRKLRAFGNEIVMSRRAYDAPE